MPSPDPTSMVSVVSPRMVSPVVGPQGQELYSCVTAANSGATGISAGMVVMPPGGISRPHLHAHSEIIVCCVAGAAVTLVGPELRPVPHAAGEFIHIPAGVVHVAVNLSSAATLVAIEMRTDPMFNEDVVVLPDLAEAAAAAANLARRDFAPSSGSAFWRVPTPRGGAPVAEAVAR
ncbi:cupin domain-containing protein [Saccharopolyspora hattusasensis]|uniref:cupin domain-containing protein n=1 Tax=Saccharopolyspora hattusasensis TaxID=1128679 RepID=UPI003D960298